MKIQILIFYLITSKKIFKKIKLFFNRIVFYLKKRWFNNFTRQTDNQIAIKNEKEYFNVIKQQNNIIKIESLNGLLIIELRDKNSKTIQYYLFNKTNDENFYINLNSINNSVNLINELFLFDKLGNTKRIFL